MGLDRLVAGAFILAGIASAGQAHHSMAMFDMDHTQALSGKVREFQWTNPHCYVQLLVKNDKGVEEEWSLEMAAPAYLQARGWRHGTVKSGDIIQVTINPLRSGAKGGLLLNAATPDGKPLGKAS